MLVQAVDWYAEKARLADCPTLLSLDLSSLSGWQLASLARCLFGETSMFGRGLVSVHDEIWAESVIDRALMVCVVRGFGGDPSLVGGDFTLSYQEANRMDAASLFLATAISGWEVIARSESAEAFAFFDHHYLLMINGEPLEELTQLCTLLENAVMKHRRA